MQVRFLGKNVISFSLLSAKFSDAINKKPKHGTVFILVIILEVSNGVLERGQRQSVSKGHGFESLGQEGIFSPLTLLKITHCHLGSITYTYCLV